MTPLKQPASRIARLQHSPTHRWKVLGIGVAANASFSAAFQGIPATAVLMRAGYRLDNAHLGLALGLLGLGIAISELPWGMLTDRWGDRRVLLLGLGSTTASLALMARFVSPGLAYVPSFAWLALGLLALGLLGGSVNGSSGRAIMVWFDESERGLAMSIRQTAIPLGGGLGAAVLPWLASRWGFAAVFWGVALICGITAGLTWLWLHEPALTENRRSRNRKEVSPAPETAPSRLRAPVTVRLVLGIGVLCAPQFAILTFATVFLHDFAHAGVATVSLTLLAVQMLAMISRVWSGRWTDRHGNRREYLQACSVLSAAAFFALALVSARYGKTREANDVMVLVAIIVVAGLFVSAWHGVAYAELATLAGTQHAGTALGMANTCVFVAFFLTPVIIPVLISQSGWSSVWWASGLCAACTLLLFPRSGRMNIHEAMP